MDIRREASSHRLVLGLVLLLGSGNIAITGLSGRENGVEERLSAIELRLDAVVDQLVEIEGDLDEITDRFRRLENRITRVETLIGINPTLPEDIRSSRNP